MSAENDLINMYTPNRGILSGRELVVFREYCLAFVHDCRQMGLAVIGIEGVWLLEEGGVKPNLDEIADFSALAGEDLCAYAERSTLAAKEFVTRMLAGGKSDGYLFVLTDHL